MRPRYRQKVKLQCPECLDRNMRRNGTRMSKKKGRMQTLTCGTCGHCVSRPIE